MVTISEFFKNWITTINGDDSGEVVPTEDTEGWLPIVPQVPQNSIKEAIDLWQDNLHKDDNPSRPEVAEGRYYLLPLTDGSVCRIDMGLTLPSVLDMADNGETKLMIQQTITFDHGAYK